MPNSLVIDDSAFQRNQRMSMLQSEACNKADGLRQLDQILGKMVILFEVESFKQLLER